MAQPTDVRVSEEILDEALEESFPASDPLSFWSGYDPRLPRSDPGSSPDGPGAGTAG